LKHLLYILVFVCTHAYGQHSVIKMPYPVNTDVYDEICPILSFDERELFFTRVGSPDFNKTIIENGENIYETYSLEKYQSRLRQIFQMITGRANVDPTNSTFNQDVWYSHFYNGEIYNLFHPPHPLNNALPNSICSHFGTEGSYVVINQFAKEGGVQAGFSIVEKKSDTEFTHPEPIVLQDFDKTGSEVNISMSSDKDYIIMAMKGPDSRGDKDLYLSVRVYENIYSTPIHIKGNLNTSFREATPFFSQDKTKLYFASNRPSGIGGMDIYVSERLDLSYKNWSEPKLIGRPVNSEANDSHPYVQMDENSILFTSNREGTSDIFYGKLIRDDSLNYKIDINIYIVKGNERKKSTAQLYWTKAYENQWDDFFRARDGKYTYTFDENVPMQFKAENRGYISDVVIVDPQELQAKGIREIDLELIIEKGKNRTPIFKYTKFKKEDIVDQKKSEIDTLPVIEDDIIPLEINSTVVLKNILFEKAKPRVLPSSFPSLIKLAETINGRSDVVIQIEGHTDNQGDAEALMNLSLERANAVRTFLLQNGVKPSQVRTKGFGASRPITKNRNEEEKSKNRRVEIRILRQK